MEKLILFALALLSFASFSQESERLYNLFGAPEHMQDIEGYQTENIDGKDYQKAIVFLDVNFSIEEIQKANQAAKEVGKNLVVLPRMRWSDRVKAADKLRTIDIHIPKEIDKLEEKIKTETDETKKEQLRAEVKTLEEKKAQYKKDVEEIVNDPNYSLQNKNLPLIFKQMEEDGLTMDSLVISGHSGGTDREGNMEYYGDFWGDDIDISRDKVISAINEYNGPATKGLDHVYISSCNAMTPYEAKTWFNGLPTLQHCTGYQGQAGRGFYDAVNSAMREDLVSSEIFYQNLMLTEQKDQDELLLQQIDDLHRNYPSVRLNLARANRNPDGSGSYAGNDGDEVTSGDLDKLAFEEEAEICKDQANEIINDFTPEFLKIKSQLTMYKMAWTTLMLSGLHKNDETRSLETVLNKNIKSFFDKVDTDPKFKKQYDHLLAYESPYKTKWMTRSQNYLPDAVNFLARKMHSTEFLESVLKDTYKGAVGEAMLPGLQEDIKDYGVDFSDSKTMELMHDLYKNDPYANRFLANIATQITSSFRGRGGLKGVDEVFYKGEINKLTKEFADLNEKVAKKVEQFCGDEAKFVEYYSDGRCKITDPVHFEGILTFGPVLEKLSLEDYEVTNSNSGYEIVSKSAPKNKAKIDKKYLKVSPMRGACNFTFQDNELPVISFKDIPKNGEYYIAYVGESGKPKQQLLQELDAKLKSSSSYVTTNQYFKDFLRENNIFTKQVMSDEISFTGNSTGTFFKHDFDQSQVDPTRASFDGIDGSYDINITKENADQFMVISSWGNNKRQINCKEGEILNNSVNPLREQRRKEQEERERIEREREQDLLIANNPSINQLSNPNAMIPWDTRNSNQEYVNQLTNGSRITHHHRENQDLGDYIILNKNANQIELYNKDGFLKRIIPVELVADSGDQLPGRQDSNGQEYNTIGAGIFTTERKGRTSADGSNDVIFINDQRGGKVKTAIRASETNPNCTNCIKVPQEYMKLVLAHMNGGDRFYVLPEDDQNYFKIKNDDIQYTTTHSSQAEDDFNSINHNYSPKDESFYENTSIVSGNYDYTDHLTPALRPRLTDLLLPNVLTAPISLGSRGVAAYRGNDRTIDLGTHGVAVKFAQTLDQEKRRLMELYGLDNDEYNELAKLSFGILGNESEFGLGNKYVIKENAQGLVSAAKWLKGNSSANSRGLTQIKEVPRAIINEYGITTNDLVYPGDAAVATLGVLAEKYKTLKRIEHRHPAITPENRFDYVLYLYYGNSSEISNGTATPEINNYVQNVKRYAENHLEIYQTKEEVN